MKKRVMSIILVLVLAFSCVPIGSITASAGADYTEPTIFVDSKNVSPGSTVEVNVNVKNNPGIAGATLNVSYDSRLTLTAAQSGSTFSRLNFTAPGRFANPSKFLWDSESGQV
ncbi:MAG: cohesin domain-containing protein, partial [Acutalibacteraceae bacterium]